MKNKFYSHILSLNPVYEKIELSGFDEDEKKSLLEIFHSHVHYEIIDIVLSELDEGKKKEFLHVLVIKEDNDSAWKLAKNHIDDVENKLIRAVNLIILDFTKDLES